MKNEAWSDKEVELVVANYLSMLRDELKGISVNKTFHRKNLAQLLNGRSDGSIEFKHQNISAVLIKLGQPYINGYKPRWNYQHILEEKTIAAIANQRTEFEFVFSQFANEGNIILPNKVDYEKFLESPPEHHLVKEPEIKYERKPIKINYLEREQMNSSLGLKGEEFVMNYEKWRLIKEGKPLFAEKVEWVSKNDDGAGFDILSKNNNGTDRYIEVKTTKLSKETPIFFSKNEYEFSNRNRTNYHLYRLFNFSQNPKMFEMKGDFDSFCSKEAIQYKGFF